MFEILVFQEYGETFFALSFFGVFFFCIFLKVGNTASGNMMNFHCMWLLNQSWIWLQKSLLLKQLHRVELLLSFRSSTIAEPFSEWSFPVVQLVCLYSLQSMITQVAFFFLLFKCTFMPGEPLFAAAAASLYHF